MSSELRSAIIEVATANEWDPVDLATIMSYETGGTLDPWKKGPTTQWGTHRGLIQWGEPQARKYGVSRDTPVRNQVYAAGRYLKDHGVKPGDGMLQLYAAINAGHASRINATDENNGGAPGTVLDKVRDQLPGHRSKAMALLGGSYNAPAPSAASASRGPNVEYAPGVDLRPQSIEVPQAPAPRVQLPDAPEADQSLWQLQKDAFNVEQTIPWMMQSESSTNDPNWQMDSDRLIDDLKQRNLDVEQYVPMMDGSQSEADYKANLLKASENQDRLNRLSQAGMTGTALRVANSMLDPVALAADIAVGSVAPQIVVGNRSRRIGKILAAATGGAAGGLAAEGVAASVNVNRDQMDMLYGTVFGFGVGGAVGALRAGPNTGFEADRFQRAAQSSLAEYEADAPAGLQGSSAGASQADKPQQFLNDEAFEFLDHGDLAETFGKGARWDLFAMMDKSKNIVTRSMAGLVQDGVGKKNGAINAIAASEERTMYRDEWVTAFNRSYKPTLSDYFKTNKVAHKDRAQAEAQFNRDVDTYIRDRRVNSDELYDPAVVKMGTKIAKLNAEILQLSQNPFLREGREGRAVMGFEGVKQDRHYTQRLYDRNRIVQANRNFQTGTMEELFAGAIRSAQPQIAEDVLKRLSSRMVKHIVNRSHGLEDLMSRNMSPENIDELIKEIGLKGDDAANLKATFAERGADDAGRDARGKRRVLLDESFKLPKVRRKDGTLDENGLSLDDLIVKDAASNFQRYADHMAGLVALARYRMKDPVSGEVLINGITSDAEFRSLLRRIQEKNAELISEGKITQRQADADIKRVQFAYDHIRGRPTNDLENTDFGWTSRAIRKFNFSRIMNQVGFAQAAEVGMTIANLGIKATFSQMPALRRIRNMNGETVLKSKLADDIEALTGLGTDRLNHQLDYKFDDLSGNWEEGGSIAQNRLDERLNKVNRVTSEISGMTQANVMSQRWAAASIVQKFANMAAKGGKGMTRNRLADLGLDEEMTDRIMKMMNTEGNLSFSEGSLSKRKVNGLNLKNWQDKEAAEAFRNTLFRYTHQIIQKNDIGNLMMWMSHPAAKMLMQFRTFMVGAYAKQTLKSLNMKDGAAFASLMFSMMTAGLSYTVQTQLQSIGRSDREEFLERRLSMDKLGAAAFARAGPVSIIPMLIDTGLLMTGNEGVFSHTRTTGQASNMAFGNPTTGGLDDLTSASQSALSGLDALFAGGQYSQEEARNLVRILPFGNSLPVVQAMNGLISDLPEFKERTY